MTSNSDLHLAQLPPLQDNEVQLAARRLLDAARTATPTQPVRDLIGAADVGAAYAVQSIVTAARVAAGARIIGRKIGLTSTAVQKQVGVDQPDFGVLFDDMLVADATPIPWLRLLQPRAEAEIAFVLGEDLDSGPITTSRVRAAVAHARAAIEIVDSRVRKWDVTISDTIADNASSGLFVLGEKRLTLDSFEPVKVSMTMRCGEQLCSSGQGSACLGDPLAAVTWLAQTTLDLGAPLRAGEIVLSGSLGPMVRVNPGDVLCAEIDGLGAVTAVFEEVETS